MNDIERAQAAKSLGNDSRYREVVEAIRREQAEVFLQPMATLEEIEDAHAIIRALDKIDGHIRRASNTLAVSQHTGNQDRGND